MPHYPHDGSAMDAKDMHEECGFKYFKSHLPGTCKMCSFFQTVGCTERERERQRELALGAGFWHSSALATSVNPSLQI